jgi:hypothetical protein
MDMGTKGTGSKEYFQELAVFARLRNLLKAPTKT